MYMNIFNCTYHMKYVDNKAKKINNANFSFFIQVFKKI